MNCHISSVREELKKLVGLLEKLNPEVQELPADASWTGKKIQKLCIENQSSQGKGVPINASEAAMIRLALIGREKGESGLKYAKRTLPAQDKGKRIRAGDSGETTNSHWTIIY